MVSNIRVHYFDMHGKAESIRMLLAHHKVDFEDVRYPREEFANIKQGLDLEFG